jgi:DcuC family C4-dicarboxylate transporter
MTALAGCLVIALAVVAIVRRVEVRLVLILAGLALGAISGDLRPIVRAFLHGLTDEKFLLPLGTCMGFAYVLRHTGCDQHLIHLLLRPLHYVRFLLVPGLVLVAAVVNVPIISQSSTAVAVGTVMVPVLRAARVARTTIAAALALGASIGGELLNPGAPELRTISGATEATSAECVARVWPLLLVHLAVTVPVFWWLSARAEGKAATDQGEPPQPPAATFALNPFKALVPLIPLLILFLTAVPAPVRIAEVPRGWLLSNEELTKLDDKEAAQLYDGRLIGAAMMVGVAIAALTAPGKAKQTATTFFEGAGYALTHITSLIIAANCFGEGVKAVGLAQPLGALVRAWPRVLFPVALLSALAFALLSGSGMATTQSLYGFFVEPAKTAGADPLRVGAVIALAAAAGRATSPVSAVVLLSASLAGAEPLAMMRRTLPALLAGLAVAVVVAMLLG